MSSETIALRTLLKARLEYVRADLLEVLERLKDEDLDWAPREGMRTIGGQLKEILATEQQDLAILKKEGTEGFKALEKAAHSSTVEEYRAKLELTRKEMIEFIDQLSDEELAQPGDFPADWFETMGLENAPISEAIRSVAQHEWYHTAQLVSYLWMRGDDPYQW